MKSDEPTRAAAVQPEPSDAALAPELLISNLLRYGLAWSLTLVVFGTAVTFFNHPDYFSSGEALNRLTSPVEAPHRLSDVLDGVAAISGQAFVMVGLLSMISIPVLRVALSFLVFRQQRNRTFMALTAFVLVMLLVALALGRAGE